jgi:hypothetical protein
MKCLVCDSEVRILDLPKANRGSVLLGACDRCGDLYQVMPNGAIRPIKEALEAHAMGDDRVRFAVSKPKIVTLQSFLEIFEMATHTFYFDLVSFGGSLRTLLAQILNRMDFAIGELAGEDMVSDKGSRVLQALREARELVSTIAPRARGVKEPGGQDDP